MNFGKIIKLAKKNKQISLYYSGANCFAEVNGAVYLLHDMPNMESPAEFCKVCDIDERDGWNISIRNAEDAGNLWIDIFTAPRPLRICLLERKCSVSLGGTSAVIFGIPDANQVEMFGSEAYGVRDEDTLIPADPSLLSPLEGIIKYSLISPDGKDVAIGAYEGDELSAVICYNREFLVGAGKLCEISAKLIRFADVCTKDGWESL